MQTVHLHFVGVGGGGGGGGHNDFVAVISMEHCVSGLILLSVHQIILEAI